MVTCVECGSIIHKIPEWLSSVNVRFVCEQCRQKHPKQMPMGDLDADTAVKPTATEDEPETIAIEDSGVSEDFEEGGEEETEEFSE